MRQSSGNPRKSNNVLVYPNSTVLFLFANFGIIVVRRGYKGEVNGMIEIHAPRRLQYLYYIRNVPWYHNRCSL